MTRRHVMGADDEAAFRARVAEWASKLRVKPAQVRLQRLTRKWASCSARGWLTFARDLLAEPPAFQDYVVVHELLHLRVKNHGKVFMSLLTAYLPGWRRAAGSHEVERRIAGRCPSAHSERSGKRS